MVDATAADVETARESVVALVGRDTTDLSAGQLRSAAVESAAENLADGLVAPLLGAVVAPTDPVLASDVQVGSPGEGEGAADDQPEGREDEHELRFALTSEAGFNDGLAFPFTYAAILVAGASVTGAKWVEKWLGFYVGYRVVVGVLAGLVLGHLFAELLFRFSPTSTIGKTVEGVEALGGTLLIYGLTELVSGYGFLAVFVAALVVRHTSGHTSTTRRSTTSPR